LRKDKSACSKNPEFKTYASINFIKKIQ